MKVSRISKKQLKAALIVTSVGLVLMTMTTRPADIGPFGVLVWFALLYAALVCIVAYTKSATIKKPIHVYTLFQIMVVLLLAMVIIALRSLGQLRGRDLLLFGGAGGSRCILLSSTFPYVSTKNRSTSENVNNWKTTVIMMTMEPSAGSVELPPPLQPEATPPTPEQHPAGSNETSRIEAAPEKAPLPPNISEKSPTLPPVTPTPPPSNDHSSHDATADSQVLPPNLIPAFATDGNKIDPGWVHAARMVIANTRENPFEEGQAIADLRQKYRERRSGTSMPNAA